MGKLFEGIGSHMGVFSVSKVKVSLKRGPERKPKSKEELEQEMRLDTAAANLVKRLETSDNAKN